MHLDGESVWFIWSLREKGVFTNGNLPDFNDIPGFMRREYHVKDSKRDDLIYALQEHMENLIQNEPSLIRDNYRRIFPSARKLMRNYVQPN